MAKGIQLDLTGPAGQDGPALYPSGLKQYSGEYVAKTGELVLVKASDATVTVKAPIFPKNGEQFGIKNISSSTANIFVSGNGASIENPGTSFQLTTGSFAVSGDGVCIIWEFNGSWYVV